MFAATGANEPSLNPPSIHVPPQSPLQSGDAQTTAYQSGISRVRNTAGQEEDGNLFKWHVECCRGGLVTSLDPLSLMQRASSRLRYLVARGRYELGNSVRRI